MGGVMKKEKQMCHKYIYDRNSELYQKWNSTTALCFINKTKCEECINAHACNGKKNENPYFIKPIKYATLMTYANCGTNGLEKFLEVNDES